MTSTLPPHVPTVPGRSRPFARYLLPVLITALAAPMLAPIVAHADTPATESTEARLRRIEGELRALQRKVFPDGAGRTFAPQITPGDAPAQPPVVSGNGAVLGDVLSRMDAVESQMKALTESSEDNQNRLAKLEARLSAVETNQAAAASAAATPASPPAAMPDAPPPVAQPRPGKAPAKAPDTAPSAPVAADHAAAVAAIERPSSDDKGEDAYTYGYRLWEAKFFPEAEAVLNDFVQQYPRHKRISFARNLLGRAYLDDNKPGAAAQWFQQNYLADKAGDRASDSLLYLGVAMTRLKEPKRACVVLDEFRATYPNELAGRLKGQFDALSKMVTCR